MNVFNCRSSNGLRLRNWLIVTHALGGQNKYHMHDKAIDNAVYNENSTCADSHAGNMPACQMGNGCQKWVENKHGGVIVYLARGIVPCPPVLVSKETPIITQSKHWPKFAMASLVHCNAIPSFGCKFDVTSCSKRLPDGTRRSDQSNRKESHCDLPNWQKHFTNTQVSRTGIFLECNVQPVGAQYAYDNEGNAYLHAYITSEVYRHEGWVAVVNLLVEPVQETKN